MTELQFTTGDLPDYIFPVRAINEERMNPFAFNLVQARDEDGNWAPNWLIVDSDGFPIARMWADSFEGLGPKLLTEKAMTYVFELHGLADHANLSVEQQFPEGSE